MWEVWGAESGLPPRGNKNFCGHVDFGLAHSSINRITSDARGGAGGRQQGLIAVRRKVGP